MLWLYTVLTEEAGASPLYNTSGLCAQESVRLEYRLSSRSTGALTSAVRHAVAGVFEEHARKEFCVDAFETVREHAVDVTHVVSKALKSNESVVILIG